MLTLQKENLFGVGKLKNRLPLCDNPVLPLDYTIQFKELVTLFVHKPDEGEAGLVLKGFVGDLGVLPHICSCFKEWGIDFVHIGGRELVDLTRVDELQVSISPGGQRALEGAKQILKALCGDLARHGSGGGRDDESQGAFVGGFARRGQGAEGLDGRNERRTRLNATGNPRGEHSRSSRRF
jgi:hypothetical protein